MSPIHSISETNTSKTITPAETIAEHFEAVCFLFDLGKHLFQMGFSAGQTAYRSCFRTKFQKAPPEDHTLQKVTIIRATIREVFSPSKPFLTPERGHIEDQLKKFGNDFGIVLTLPILDNEKTITAAATINKLPLEMTTVPTNDHDLEFEDLHWMGRHYLGLRHVTGNAQAMDNLQNGYNGDSVSLGSSWTYLKTIIAELNDQNVIYTPQILFDYKYSSPESYFEEIFKNMSPELADSIKQEFTQQYKKSIESAIKTGFELDASNSDAYFFLTFNSGNRGSPAYSPYDFGRFPLGKIGRSRHFASEIVAVIKPSPSEDPVKSTFQAFLHLIKSKDFRSRVEGFVSSLKNNPLDI